jgi:5-methylcytosine-specific restriction endonuclease McrA
MARLTTLKPRVQTLNTQRVATLEAKAGTTERVRGRAWMATRQRVAVAQQFKCRRCGCVWLPWRDQVDHRTPLEQGGSNDDANLQTPVRRVPQGRDSERGACKKPRRNNQRDWSLIGAQNCANVAK